MSRLKYVLNILLLFAGQVTHAQHDSGITIKKCPVNTINYEQGLLNNQTDAIITDFLGFSWVSTTIGLQRYTGYTLENVNPVINGDTIKIKTPVCFFNLRSGMLWISCKKGVLQYNPGSNTFKNIIPEHHPSEAFYSIVPLKETNEGIWCIQQNVGLVIYSRDGHLVTVDSAVSKGMINKVFAAENLIYITNKDFLFFADDERHQLIEYNTTTHRLVATRKSAPLIFDVSCNATSLYMNTVSGLSRISINDWKLLGYFPFSNVTSQAISTSRCTTVGDGRVIASVNNQLIELSASLHGFKIFNTLNGLPVLVTGGISRVYYDDFQRIWLITNDDIKRIQDREIPFGYFKYPASPNNFVRSLYFDEKKRLLLAGCLNGGLQLYNEQAKPLWAEPLKNEDVKDVLSINKLADNVYLVVTWLKGWYLLNLSKQQLTRFDFKDQKQYQRQLYDNGFTCNVRRLNDSTLIIACKTNVFNCVFKGSRLVSVRPLLPNIKNKDLITSFTYSRNGVLWAGCYKGNVYKLSQNGQLQNLRLPDQFTVRCMAEDAAGNIWVGSNSGLYVYDVAGHLLKSFLKSSGLLNDCIYSMIPLASGSEVIASSNLGLSDVSLNGTIKNYTKELGLQDNEFNTDAAIKTADGKFYFGGINGISSFYPAALKESLDKPLLNITRLVVNDSSYNSSAGIWRGDTIELQHNRNHLQFDFAAMGLLNANKYLYHYRLLGFEKKWQSTYQPSGIRYILGSGNYTMEVVAGNTSSPQTFSRKVITIIIHPPWWLTWWSLTFMSVLAVASVILVVSFYNKRRYKKKLQELMITQRLQTERERISRDLHDNLGAQANAIFYATELLLKADHDPNLVDNLHDTAGDMLTILRETLWAMKITQVEAADLWLRVLNFARKISTYYANLKIDISGTPPAKLTLNASLALNMILIVQEAISNAIRHAEASVITISSYHNDNLWRIEIIDDGKGFDLSAVSRKIESYGLENMSERATECGIAFKINSLPAHGTKVFIEINLHKMESQFSRQVS